MPLTIFFGLLTLAPLVMALAVAGLGLAHRASARLTLGLTLVGVVIPIIGLALLAAEVTGAFPLEIALLGDQSSWFALFGRADALAVYAAIGVAVVVAPLLVWLAWRAAPLDAEEQSEVDAAEDTEDAGETEASVAAIPAPHALGEWQWLGVALALALETLALWLCFAENIVLVGAVWIALVAVAWWVGELGSEAAVFDWRGLGLMVVGPVVWLITVLLIAVPAGARRLIDLMGAGRLPTGHLFAICLALAFAVGGYPALVWLRKRASIATPAGLAAASLAVMPAALLVGLRTFSIGATSSSDWAPFAIGKPPVTIGITLTLLGAASVIIAGLQALGRRDPRSVVAALTLAQAGWGLVALGVGAPISVLGLALLLATAVIGLGAVIASLVASGAITADIEPESAGPRILGEPLRPLLLFGWAVGAASLVGAPLFAGFAPQQLITAEALTGPRLAIPLVGLAWAGSLALAIALVRVIAPAFTAPLVEVYAAADGEAEPVATPPELRLEELPAVALGVVVVLAGVAPGVALSLATGAANAALQAGALDGVVASSPSGYAAGAGQWFATAPAVFVAIGALALAYLRSRAPREIRPLYLAGQTAGEVADERVVEGSVEVAEQPAELVALPEPTDTWSDLGAALRSGWMTPGSAWLGLDTDEENLTADEQFADEDADDDTEDESAEGEGAATSATAQATDGAGGGQA